MTDDDTSLYRAQARRCRRLAATMLDDDIRHALEDLAQEYEAKAGDDNAAAEPFMFRKRERGAHPQR